MILCNQHCVNYQCNKRASLPELQNKSKWQGKELLSYSDLKTESCGFKLDFLRNDNINEFVNNKIGDT